MAELTDNDRVGIWSDYMAQSSADRTEIGLKKPELRAAVNAVDDWIEANALSFNSALPLPARTALTARQKARLLAFVIRRRFEVS